jgi:hypothetical protein
MAKKKNQNPIDALNAADEKHYRDTERYVKVVESLYKDAISEISQLAAKVGAIPATDQFSFSKNPAISQQVDGVIRKLASKIQAVIETGDRQQWDAACAKSVSFLNSIMRTSALPKPLLQSYQDRNLEALAAFQERKINGLGLSERVWNYVSPLKQEIETVADTSKAYMNNGINTPDAMETVERALGTGLSADDLSREVRACLKEPNKLFRRVRDKYGNLQLSKNAKLYHPGQGVYRSSYKNAKRMTRSEINMAYRQSDYLRWQQLDFVVGLRVQLSGNHTCLGKDGKPHPFFDICDILQGDYPKDAKLVGWHPQCKCIITPIMKPYDEWNQDRAYLNAKAYKQLPASNEVTDVPKGFKDYIRENQKRIAGWTSTPYYIKDNPHFFDKAINPGKYSGKRLILNADESNLLKDYRMYGFNHQGSSKFALALDDALKAYMSGDRSAFNTAMTSMDFIKRTNERVKEYTAMKRAMEDLYVVLKAHPSYTDVQYNPKTGGLKATHKDHTFDPNKGKYEMSARDAGYASGHVVILGKEKSTTIGQKFSEGLWDGTEFEVMGCETASKNNYLRGLKHANSKPDAKIAVLDFPNGGYSEEMIEEAIRRYKGLIKSDPDNFRELERVVCVQDGKVVYDQPFKKSTGGSESLQYTPRSAKIEDINNLTKKLSSEIGLDDSKLRLLKSKVTKKTIDPAQERHKYDDQIAMLKKNAQRYGLDVNAIDEAFASLDLKKLQRVIDEQQKILDEGMAKKKKIWDAADKRHAERTAEKAAKLKEFAKEHKAKTESVYKQVDGAIANAKGINEADVSVLKDLKSGKAGSITTKAGKIVPTVTVETLQKEAQKLEQIVAEYNSVMNEAKALVADFKGISDVDTETVLKQTSIKGVKAELKKLQDARKQIIDEAVSLKKDFDGVKDLDMKLVDKTIKSGKLSSIREISDKIKEIKKAEEAISDLIPNAHELHKSYTLSELQQAHKELDGVLSKWLSKYSYSSIDNAPLEHLRNKLEFELSSPTFRYTDKTIISKAVNEKIAVINRKIEWNNLVSQVSSLKTFSSKASAYKALLAKVEEAVNSNDLDALKKSIAAAEAEQRKILEKRAKRGGDTKTALNKEYKGGAIGTDISASIDVRNMVSEDPYGGTFTNNVARMQGFDSPAKLVTAAEFDTLEKNCGEVFYRTVNPTTFKGKKMTSEEFASQLYVADKLELNGPGGRVYGDGMYVAVSAWDGRSVRPLSPALKSHAYNASICYGNGDHTISEMTFTRKPRIIKERDLDAMWRKLDTTTRAKFGNEANTYACALGYDAMYTTRDYMVIWNRSIIAVKKK